MQWRGRTSLWFRAWPEGRSVTSLAQGGLDSPGDHLADEVIDCLLIGRLRQSENLADFLLAEDDKRLANAFPGHLERLGKSVDGIFDLCGGGKDARAEAQCAGFEGPRDAVCLGGAMQPGAGGNLEDFV